MYNNPLAIVIRDAFIQNVYLRPTKSDNDNISRNTIQNILRHKRITLFEKSINRFLIKCGQPPLPETSQFINEKDLLIFSLQLSGYIRDAQKQLNTLQSSHACDPDLINLYKAAAKYSVECNEQIEDSKYIFKEHCPYRFYKIKNHDTLSNAKFNNHGFIVNPHRPNLLLAMPFHIKDTQEELQKWTSKYLNKSLDNKSIFGSQVDVYLAHFPIEQPRGEKFALSLETIRSPETFFDKSDMDFIRQNFLPFIGTDITIDKNNKITGGNFVSANEFKENCKNITILGYCAGSAHAHRWLNAFSHLASQIYDTKTTEAALSNICMVSYAFLPIQKRPKYSGIYLMSNYENDNLRKEPFIKMFNPEGYEKAKFTPDYNIAHISTLSDNRGYIVAFKLAENFMISEGDKKTFLPDIEHGHHMAVVSAKNANSNSNYPNKLFTSIIQNVSLGKRGEEMLNLSIITKQDHHHIKPPYMSIINYRQSVNQK